MQCLISRIKAELCCTTPLSMHAKTFTSWTQTSSFNILGELSRGTVGMRETGDS